MLQINHVWRAMLQMNLIMCEEAYRIQTWLVSWIQTSHVTVPRGPAWGRVDTWLMYVCDAWGRVDTCNVADKSFDMWGGVSYTCISTYVYSTLHLIIAHVYSTLHHTHTCVYSTLHHIHAWVMPQYKTCHVTLYIWKGHYTPYEWVCHIIWMRNVKPYEWVISHHMNE